MVAQLLQGRGRRPREGGLRGGAFNARGGGRRAGGAGEPHCAGEPRCGLRLFRGGGVGDGGGAAGVERGLRS
eukprot:2909740-Pyramimonas_sp.AAC.1